MKDKPKKNIIETIRNFKKGKIAMIITIMIACFALTLVMTMQFKIVNEIIREAISINIIRNYL